MPGPAANAAIGNEKRLKEVVRKRVSNRRRDWSWVEKRERNEIESERQGAVCRVSKRQRKRPQPTRAGATLRKTQRL